MKANTKADRYRVGWMETTHGQGFDRSNLIAAVGRRDDHPARSPSRLTQHASRHGRVRTAALSKNISVHHHHHVSQHALVLQKTSRSDIKLQTNESTCTATRPHHRSR
uniref:Uncharacterized protein n=1 Tax=Plectus sambesii TaxID=2011161 RepID=A0A914XGF7_9BILA